MESTVLQQSGTGRAGPAPDGTQARCSCVMTGRRPPRGTAPKAAQPRLRHATRAPDAARGWLSASRVMSRHAGAEERRQRGAAAAEVALGCPRERSPQPRSSRGRNNEVGFGVMARGRQTTPAGRPAVAAAPRSAKPGISTPRRRHRHVCPSKNLRHAPPRYSATVTCSVPVCSRQRCGSGLAIREKS